MEILLYFLLLGCGNSLFRALVAGFLKTDKEFQSRGVNFSFYSCVFLRIEYWEGRHTELEDLDFFYLHIIDYNDYASC